MTNKMDAIREYAPRIVPGQPVDDEDLIEIMTKDTGQSEGEAKQALTNALEAIRYFLNLGCNVNLKTFGAFSKHIQLDGTFDTAFREDVKNKKRAKSEFRGKIVNARNIGKSLQDLIDMWNADPAQQLIGCLR